MPSDRTFRIVNAVHHAAQRLSFGRLGWMAGGMPVVELTTVGRRSGQPRTVLLTSPLRIDDGYLVVASRGGDDRPPAWLGNLTADPRVQVALRGRRRQGWTGRVATAEERALWWPQVVARYPRYGDYQNNTARPIALVKLEPAAGEADAPPGGSAPQGGGEDLR